MLITAVVSAQESIDTQKLILKKKVVNLAELIAAIESQTDYFVSYNTKEVDLSTTLKFENKITGLSNLRKVIEETTFSAIELDTKSKKLIILPPKYKILYGIIRDSASLETLTAVNVFTRENKGTTTNDDGFFYLKVNSEIDYIYISYLGYRTQVLPIYRSNQNELTIQLISDNILPDIVIKANSDVPPPSTFNPKDIKIDQASPIKGIGGRADLISSVKHTTGVSVGSEAQNGFTVRGGGPDQNLVLLDGLPVYETSHLGGLSSIFVDNIIKKADLYKGGIPARFGGKLSSVLDIRLKEGNRYKFKRELMLNLENLSGFIEGPILKNTSFIFNGRTSVLDLYSKPILTKYLNFEDSELKYNDLYSKLTHWFSPSNRLSLSVYSGDDKISLNRNDQSSGLSFTDSNRIEWRNTLFALNWNTALTNKLFLHGHAGRSAFDFNSRSANKVNTAIDSSSLEIDVYSRQIDYTLKLDVDLYTDNFGILKVGGGIIFHESSPSILESRSFEEAPRTEPDSTYYSNERYLFIENNLNLSKHWKLNTGLRYNSYRGLDTTYLYLQPRINLQYSADHWQFNIGYSSMSQFLHLLNNPSSGLPSDLWVPSTKKIEPETSQLSSIEWRYKTDKGMEFGLGGFYNRYSKLIDYSNPFEIIQVIVSDHDIFNPDVSKINWEDRVSVGKGEAYGMEVDLVFMFNKFRCSLAYTLSKSLRTFSFGDFSRNSIDVYPYKYDRPHNIAASGEYSLKKNRKINFEWLFGNGNTWTISEDLIPGPDGNPIIDNPKQRNGERLSDYHTLNVSYSDEVQLHNEGVISYTLGIYNIYNNKNPFYSYIQETTPKEKEISLYPIFPQINIGYSW